MVSKTEQPRILMKPAFLLHQTLTVKADLYMTYVNEESIDAFSTTAVLLRFDLHGLLHKTDVTHDPRKKCKVRFLANKFTPAGSLQQARVAGYPLGQQPAIRGSNTGAWQNVSGKPLPGQQFPFSGSNAVVVVVAIGTPQQERRGVFS